MKVPRQHAEVLYPAGPGGQAAAGDREVEARLGVWLSNIKSPARRAKLTADQLTLLTSPRTPLGVGAPPGACGTAERAACPAGESARRERCRAGPALRAAGAGTYPYPMGMDTRSAAADANIRIPQGAKERLAAVAASEGKSLRAYLTGLADSLLTRQERVEQAERARRVMKEWTGYVPDEGEQRRLNRELDERLARAVGR